MRTYAVAHLGQSTWDEMLERVGREPAFEYQFDQVYPDAELGALARTGADISGEPITNVLEEFGEALIPVMFGYYGFLVNPRWSYTDFLLNMESLLHSALRLHTPGAPTSRVHVVQTGPEEVRIVYDSPLRVCAAVRGIIRGAAAKYHVDAEIVDERCVLRDDPECVITVSRLD
jgi:hypothetical protein